MKNVVLNDIDRRRDELLICPFKGRLMMGIPKTNGD